MTYFAAKLLFYGIQNGFQNDKEKMKNNVDV
jgi:hypothetical protein